MRFIFLYFRHLKQKRRRVGKSSTFYTAAMLQHLTMYSELYYENFLFMINKFELGK